MDIDSYMKDRERTPREIGGIILVYNGHGRIVATYSAMELAKQWFCMSNDAFFSLYGFNWVPRGRLYDAARKAVGKA